VKRGALRSLVPIALVVAAVLSVITIPVAVAFVSRSQGATWTAVGTAIAGLAALISFLFAWVTYARASTIEAELRVRVFGLRIRIGYASSGDPLLITEGTAEAQLLHELSVIEQDAQALVGEGHNISVIRLRSWLRASGIWSENDVRDFDDALRTRNGVAHGDEEELSRASVAKAVETMQRLRRKLEANQLEAGSLYPRPWPGCSGEWQRERRPGCREILAEFEAASCCTPTGHQPRVAITGMEISPDGFDLAD
jgi:hypothetical protein